MAHIDGPVVVGVSGGGDSLALLHLLVAAGHDCEAVTVDHRLRAGSDADGAFVAAICREWGVPHTVVARPEGARWTSQASARIGRYDALACAADGRAVLVAHTLDDQAETVRMRAHRGGGTLGLSGIAPVATLVGRTRLLRPLLRSGRAELRDYLGAIAATWIDDPANRDPRFERVRVRDRAGTQRLGRLADAARGHRAATMAHVAVDLRANLHLSGNDLRYRPAIGGTLLVHAVRFCAAWVGRDAYLPSQARVAHFLAAEPAITVAGAVIRKRGDVLDFHPDPRRSMHGRARPFERFRPLSDDPVHAVLSALS